MSEPLWLILFGVAWFVTGMTVMHVYKHIRGRDVSAAEFEKMSQRHINQIISEEGLKK